MLVQYGIPLLITLCLICTIALLFRAVISPVHTYVEIIISGDDKTEDLENAVITAKRISEKYFNNACVYIRGEENAYLNAICRRFDIQRKD